MFPQRRMTTDTPDGNYEQALNLFVRGEDGWVQMPSRSISLNDYMKQLIKAHNADPKVGGSRTSRHLYGIAADWRTVDRSVNPVALGIIAAAQGFGAVGIYWHDKAAIVHTDTRGGKATWLCVQPGVYPSTTYNKFVLPTIEQGCTGAANRAATVMLQRLLGITHDGGFGPATTKALMEVQRKHGLAADGICGPKSWTVLSGADKYL